MATPFSMCTTARGQSSYSQSAEEEALGTWASMGHILTCKQKRALKIPLSPRRQEEQRKKEQKALATLAELPDSDCLLAKPGLLEFPLFAKLPVEIQQQIWRETFQAFPHRMGLLTHESDQVLCKVIQATAKRSPIVASQVNRQSRQEFQLRYQSLRVPDSAFPITYKPILFNKDIDTVIIPCGVPQTLRDPTLFWGQHNWLTTATKINIYVGSELTHLVEFVNTKKQFIKYLGGLKRLTFSFNTNDWVSIKEVAEDCRQHLTKRFQGLVDKGFRKTVPDVEFEFKRLVDKSEYTRALKALPDLFRENGRLSLEEVIC